jgi:hypothetical protein
MDNQLQQKDIDNLTHNLKRVEDSVIAGFSKVNDRLDLMNDHFIRKDLFENEIKQLDRDIAELQDANKWLTRTVGSVVLTLLITGGLSAFMLLK